MKLPHTLNKLHGTQAQFYASIVLFLLAGCMLIAAYIQEQPPTQKEANPQQPYSAGVTIKQGSVAMTISDLHYDNGNGVFTAPADKHYLIFTFTVKNRSDRQVNVLPSSDTYVKTTAGKVIYLTPFTLDNPFRAGELPPGEQIQGQLSYLVPKNETSKFFVDAIWSGGVIPFAIK